MMSDGFDRDTSQDSEESSRGTPQALLRDDRQGAVISEDGAYRYRLWREWNAQKPTLAFVMLNPSTADASEDDPTIRRCLGYAKDWGYGKLVVANLFALRSTDPSNLRDHPNPVGPENDGHLQQVCDGAEKVIVAWGTDGSLRDREMEVAGLLDDRDLFALATTKDGHPAHPLYQPADTDPTLWEVTA